MRRRSVPVSAGMHEVKRINPRAFLRVRKKVAVSCALHMQTQRLFSPLIQDSLAGALIPGTEKIAPLRKSIAPTALTDALYASE